jgi:hypothetical protein
MQVELHAIDAGGKLELIAMGRVVAEHSVRSLSPPATELGFTSSVTIKRPKSDRSDFG